MSEEARVVVSDDGGPDLSHQAQQIVDVVYAEQVGTSSLLCGQMMDIRSGDGQATISNRATTGTGAAFLHSPEVVGILGVFEVQNSFGRHCITKALR